MSHNFVYSTERDQRLGLVTGTAKISKGVVGVS